MTTDQPQKIIDDVYLGDGVYASFDGYHIWLDLRNQGTLSIPIALEPEVFSGLVDYRMKCMQAIEQKRIDEQGES